MLNRFSSVLIANRGEIAARIIRSAQAQGLRAIAVHTDADADAPHVAMADDALRIGAGPVADSYLNPQAILDAAARSGAGAIHPGYGFLSESADFARAVAQAGLVFIGPSPEAIEIMGDKSAAKRAMIAAGVPCVPGYEGADQSDATLITEAARIGYPLMVKASAGGGGRGMRLVPCADALPAALDRARSEALGAFGSDHLILERAIQTARHIEIQVFADSLGTCLHLGERDCSVQRRHQKVIEEAPAPGMTADLRARMGQAAITAARAVNYCGAGTVEFLLDAEGAFCFLEMNTRLQVEHPVTEAVTGLDLVAMQLRVAQGAPLELAQSDVQLTGHAIEVRLYAEDPGTDFLPVTGRISAWDPPAGLRVDAGIRTGLEVSPFYDPMLGKLIAHGSDRDSALQKLRRGLEHTVLLGLPSNLGFLRAVLESAPFAAGQATTDLLADHWPDGLAAPVPGSGDLAIAAALLLEADHAAALTASPLKDGTLRGLGGVHAWIDLAHGDQVHRLSARPLDGGWQVSDAAEGWLHDVHLRAGLPRASLKLDGRARSTHAALNGRGIDLSVDGQSLHFSRHTPWTANRETAGSGRIAAPMPGQLVALSVAGGDMVEPGQTVAVIEAMKMQHQLRATTAGRVAQIHAAPGDQLTKGQILVTIDGDATP